MNSTLILGLFFAIVTLSLNAKSRDGGDEIQGVSAEDLKDIKDGPDIIIPKSTRRSVGGKLLSLSSKRLQSTYVLCSNLYGSAGRCEEDGIILNAYLVRSRPHSGCLRYGREAIGWAYKYLILARGCSGTFSVLYRVFLKRDYGSRGR